MIAVIFPGQGSQKPGMGQDLFLNDKYAKDAFDRVRAATSIDVATLCFQSDEETLRQTQNAQMALYTCAVAAVEALNARWLKRRIAGDSTPNRPFYQGAAGHSVGEYAAVASSYAVGVDDGARLVKRRGELMATAKSGGMAAVLGLERERLETLLAPYEGRVVVANDNCPGQLVISGEAGALAEVSKELPTAGAKRVLPLNVSGAFHSPLMAEAAEAFQADLAKISFGALSADPIPVFSNVTASPVNDASQWPSLLARQLASPVRWTESVRAMIAAGFDTFVECGSGEVLSGLIKRIDPNVKTLKVVDVASLGQAEAELFGG